ncbi:PepSY domain-containing protein [Mycolicibacterium sp. P1-5]|uniref:PepSY-associated TM helix domain-containing protein n=1 Tax=Mycolicibacterium sp. P1-5 TaxID=2024617 RepID=UPI0011EBB7CB|nr:PepSY domain-containing protein [Mycolicibacterium sp. P1-5]KAA0100332.1 PepSY domain-containing protein [Mycolicibacterium sp. P1-5]
MTTTETAARRGDAAVLRRIWRLHFWVGLFAAPVLVVLACSGLVILYSQPLDALLNRHLLVVEQGPQTVPLDAQVTAATQHVGAGHTLEAVTPPDGPHSSSRMDFSDADAKGYPQAEANVIQVFVDPYTGAYLGQRTQLSGLVGWANQLHRMFGNDGPQIQLPSLGHLINPSAYPEPTIGAGIGNLWMELTAIWIVVLLGSGIYLWWPRAIGAGKPLLKVRWREGGRIRWRDVHALTGVVIAVVGICYILSGMTWTRYWGENWRAVTATVTPSAEIDAPSTPVKLGDFDRLGRRIAWAAVDDPIYASQPTAGAARLSYNDIDRIAEDEHMVPGYTIFPPRDTSKDGTTTYGSYTVVNRWPQRVSEQRTLYLNQFTGATITDATAARDGALSRLTSFGIAMHMGNQMGWLTRISATVACLGVLLSAGTGLLMWWKRRPAGRSGLPGPTSETTRANTPKKAMITVTVAAVILGILFPAFGVSLLVVLVVEGIISARRPPPDQASLVTSTTTSRSVEPSPE